MPSSERIPQSRPSTFDTQEYLMILDRMRSLLVVYEPYYLGSRTVALQSAPLTKERYGAFEDWLEGILRSQNAPTGINTQKFAQDTVLITLLYEALQSLPSADGLSEQIREALFGLERINIEEARKILGSENVHGPEDVEYLLGFCPQDIPPIPYTKEDLEKSLEIKQKTGVEEMLVLFVHDQDGTPLTGERLHDLIQKKYDELNLGKFLFNVASYKNAASYDVGLSLKWKLITKKCIPGSKNKRHDWKPGDTWKREESQECAIEEYARSIDLPREALSRPAPFEMLYAVALHLVSTEKYHGPGKGERLLESEYHCSDSVTSAGGFVHVGSAGRGGADVGGYPRVAWYDYGVCCSR